MNVTFSSKLGVMLVLYKDRTYSFLKYKKIKLKGVVYER